MGSFRTIGIGLEWWNDGYSTRRPTSRNWVRFAHLALGGPACPRPFPGARVKLGLFCTIALHPAGSIPSSPSELGSFCTVGIGLEWWNDGYSTRRPTPRNWVRFAQSALQIGFVLTTGYRLLTTGYRLLASFRTFVPRPTPLGSCSTRHGGNWVRFARFRFCATLPACRFGRIGFVWRI